MPDGVAQGKADDHHVNGVVDQQEKSALKNRIKMFEVLLPSSMFVPKFLKFTTICPFQIFSFYITQSLFNH